MDKDYILTLFSEKMKGVSTLMSTVSRLSDKFSSFASETQTHEKTAFRQLLSDLQGKTIDFSSVETMAESIEQALNMLNRAVSMIEKLNIEAKKPTAFEGMSDDKVQSLLHAKILKFRNRENIAPNQLTPIIYFGGESDMSIYDVILGFAEDMYVARQYIHNIFYGLRDGEFPVDAFVKHKESKC